MRTRLHLQAVPDADPAALADPEDVAGRIVALLATAPPGARVAA
jgi:hypothetical protein